jgi:hypothetical protein
MADTGLLISHAFREKTVKSEDLYLKLALGKLELNEGMMIENVVTQMFRAAGYDLYFLFSISFPNTQKKLHRVRATHCRR